MKRKKDGSLYKSSTVVSGEDFATMLSFVKKKVRTLGEEMSRGQIDVSPYLLGDQKGCTYCPYHGVCGFDPSLTGYDYRRLKSISREEILNLMKESADA